MIHCLYCYSLLLGRKTIFVPEY